MTGRHFIKIIIPAVSMAYAGEEGCSVDLTAKAPCGQDLRKQLQDAATDEMQTLKEDDSDPEVKPALQTEEEYDTLPCKTPAPIKSPEKSQASPPVEDDLGESQ